MNDRTRDPRAILERLVRLAPADQYGRRVEIFRAWLPACRRIADDGDAGSLVPFLPATTSDKTPLAAVFDRDPRWGERARALVGLAMLARRLRDGGVGEATVADLLQGSVTAWEAANADGGEGPTRQLSAAEIEREPLVVRQGLELFDALVANGRLARGSDGCGIVEALRHLARFPDPWARATQVRFVVDADPAAVVVITLERRHGAGRVLRHVAANPFLRVNRSFIDGVSAGSAAVSLTWPTSPADVDVRWRLEGERWGDGEEIAGGSAALAIAVARRACLDPAARWEIHPGYALTGAVNGVRIAPVGRFAGKAEAAAALGLALVVPAPNLSEARAAARVDQVIVPAATVLDAAELVLRLSSEEAKPEARGPGDTFGRDRERRELARLLDAGHRLITLVGPPGIGKSHLARAVAADHAGARLVVELESREGPAAVAMAVVEALGAETGKGDDVNRLVVRLLAERRVLLVLDNFEHLLDAAPILEEWLSAAPQLSLLVTSQRRLELASERAFPVGPLDVPAEGTVDVEEMLAAPAAALFVSTARRNGFDIDLGRLGAAVTALCRAVDGVPLAIRLAAGLVSTVSPDALSEALRNGAISLARPAGARGSDRHSSMDAAVEWAYSFLDDERQGLLGQLWVFQAAFSLDAAAAVCGCGEEDGRLIANLAGLVAASLVESFVDPTLAGGGVRFRLLSVVRWFAGKRVGDGPTRDLCLRRHTAYYLGVVRRVGAQLTGDGQADALNRLAADEADVSAALDRIIAEGDTAMAATFGRFLFRYWLARGRAGQGRARMSAVLALHGAPSEDLAVALVGAAALAQEVGDNHAGRVHLKEAEAMARSLGSNLALALALVNLGHLADDDRNFDVAHSLYEEASAVAAVVVGGSGRRLVGHAEIGMGVVAARHLDWVLAERHFELAEGIFHELGDRRSRAQAMLDLGELAVEAGSATATATITAQRWLEEALAIGRALRDERIASVALTDLANVDLMLGARARAIERLLEALGIALRLGLRRGEADAVEGLIGALEGRPVWVARLYGRAQAIRGQIGIQSDNTERWQPFVGAASELLKDAFRAEVAAGADMTSASIQAALSAEFPETS